MALLFHRHCKALFTSCFLPAKQLVPQVPYHACMFLMYNACNLGYATHRHLEAGLVGSMSDSCLPTFTPTYLVQSSSCCLLLIQLFHIYNIARLSAATQPAELWSQCKKADTVSDGLHAHGPFWHTHQTHVGNTHIHSKNRTPNRRPAEIFTSG